MADFHEAVFWWPYAGEDVILTGTFDQWSRSMHLVRGPSGFEGTVRVPWGQKVAYKFIVDGRWMTTDQALTEPDGAGNTNNIYYAPPNPTSFTIVNEPPTVAVVPAVQPSTTTPEAPKAVEGKIQETPETHSPIANGTAVVPVSPVSQNEPVQSPVVKSTPAVPFTSSPQDGPVSPPAKTSAKELPVAPIEPKLVDAAGPVIAPKIPLPIVPVNDSNAAFATPISVSDASQSESTPSTHTPFVNRPRKSVNGSPPVVPDEDEKKSNGTNEINGTIGTSSSSSPPTTPKKHTFPGSDSPINPKDGSLRSKFGSTRSKRHSFFEKLKVLFTPEKDKHKRNTRPKSEG